MFLAVITILILRKDLIKESVLGSMLFLILHFIILFIFNMFIFPNNIANAWNFEYISGVTLLGIPIEELLWGAVFGALWAPLYETLNGYRVE